MFKTVVKSKYVIAEGQEADAAPPSAALKKEVYYHGTTTTENANKIWKGGIKPDLSDVGDWETHKPVKGHVYCTRDIFSAFMYAAVDNCGRDRQASEHILSDAIFYEGPGGNYKDPIPEYGKYGYVFVIPASQFKDVHPDEDEVGKAVHDKAFPWLNKLAEQKLADEESENIEECASDSLLEDVDNQCYRCWIKAGKLLLPLLTDKQKLDIIKKYSNVAHAGVLKPTEMWRFDRTRLPDIFDSKSKNVKPGFDFFQFAKRLK